MNARFLVVNILLLAAVIALAQLTFEPFTKLPWPHWAVHFLFVWLLVMALGGYALLDKKMQSKPREFINTFMVVSGLRMMVSVIVIVFLVLFFPVQGKYISVYYVTGYLLFLIIEVIFLFKRSKEVN